MKTIVTTLFLCGVLALHAQPSFDSAILRGKQMLDTTRTKTGYTSVINYFERIALREKAEWLPLYYQAQAVTFRANQEADQEVRDSELLQALDLVRSARKLNSNSELMALEGFVQMLRISIDPSTRGQSLTPEVFGLLKQALAMDPKNPRALLFLGQMEYGMAQFFGKDSNEACGYIEQAHGIFEQASDDPTIMPDWGAVNAVAYLQKCTDGTK